MSKNTESTKPQYSFLQSNDPVCLIIKATLKPIGDTDRFQPAGFPEVGHVIYDAPRIDKGGNRFKEKVCIVDSPASMANHLETVCMKGVGETELHDDLAGLPYVICKTNPARIEDGSVVLESTDPTIIVATTCSEGHRLASDYFVHEKDRPTVIGGEFDGRYFRDVLRKKFGIVELPKKKGSTFFFPSSQWWDIYKTIFNLDPNSLVHGVMFAKEQIKISRLLTAHLEAFGATRVGRSGVKFDPLGKTTSGQPIFAVDEETANEIRATFIVDLALLRSYGRDENGLSPKQKKLLLDLILWKIKELLVRPFRYRTQCFLGCTSVAIETERDVIDAAPPKSEVVLGAEAETTDVTRSHEKISEEPQTFLKEFPVLLANVDVRTSITDCAFASTQPTQVYYPADKFYKAADDTIADDKSDDDAASQADSDEDDNE